MLLACDIGNTNIKAGIFSDDKLIEVHFLKGIIPLIGLIKINKLREIVVSSVVPSKTKHLTDILHNLKLNPSTINKDSSFNLKIDYDSPETLGIDRICSAEGAFQLYCRESEFKKEQIIISIDLGTATTLNVVKYPGIFVGGIIAPGTDLMFRSLKNDTAQLPNVSSKAVSFFNDLNIRSVPGAIIPPANIPGYFIIFKVVAVPRSIDIII